MQETQVLLRVRKLRIRKPCGAAKKKKKICKKWESNLKKQMLYWKLHPYTWRETENKKQMERQGLKTAGKNLTVRIIVRFWMKQESKDPKLLLQSRSLFSRLLVLFLAPQAIPICLVKKVTISKPKLVSKFSLSNPLETVKTPKTERWLSKL